MQNQNSLPCPECEGQLVLQKDTIDTDDKEREHTFFTCNSCGLRLEIHVEDDFPKNGTEKRYQCDICNRFYATPVTLKVHRLLHTSDKTELCDFCGASFKTRGQLKIHKRVHTGEKPYKCNECDKSFPYRESLITHSTVHTRIKPFLSIQQEHEQLKLLRDLSEPIDEFYRCKLCPQQYTTLYLMARHLERLHSVKLDRARNKLQYIKNTTKHDRRYRCKYCDQTYVNPTCLQKHLLKHGPDGCLRWKCSCCDEYFMTQDETSLHELEQHRDRLECKVCQKLFKKPDQLLRHTRYKHSTNGKDRNKYMCAQCSKNFPSKIALSDHERAECGTSPIYPCDKCNKRYSSFSSLKMHQTMHENQLPFVCSFCGKRFRTKGQQKVHERSHTGEKPFQCDQCTRAFSYRESLMTHLSTHTGVMRYGCTDCERRFSCITNFQAHRRVHHKAVGTSLPKPDTKADDVR
uniref:C2H2-type domain-containing protein n=1 Tax=Anopheles culicifacies TaxID=139723 RepID=A0A182LRR0_9DIPT